MRNYSSLTEEELERFLYMRLGKSPVIDAAHAALVYNMGNGQEIEELEKELDEKAQEKCPVCEANLF